MNKNKKMFFADDEFELFVFLEKSDIKTEKDSYGDSYEYFLDSELNKRCMQIDSSAGFCEHSAAEYEDGTEESENYFRNLYTKKGFIEVFPYFDRTKTDSKRDEDMQLIINKLKKSMKPKYPKN